MADYSKYEAYLQLLDFRDVSPLEAERIAEKCFMAQALAVRDLAAAEYKDLIVADSLDVVESELMLTVPTEFKNADTRKAWVTTQQRRKDEYQKRATAKTSVEYLKRLLKLFEEASRYYGGKAKR